jgi:hypothetical protein
MTVIPSTYEYIHSPVVMNLSGSGISPQFHSAKNKRRERLVEKQGDLSYFLSRRADESNRTTLLIWPDNPVTNPPLSAHFYRTQLTSLPVPNDQLSVQMRHNPT